MDTSYKIRKKEVIESVINFIKSLPKLIKTAFYSLFRNFAMTFTAASLVTITMIVFSLFLMVTGNVVLFGESVKENLQIHVILNEGVDEAMAKEHIPMIKQVDNVKDVVFSSKDEELELMIKEKGDAFAIYKGKQNPLHHAYFVTVKKAEDIKKTSEAIQALPDIEAVQYGGTSVFSLIEVLNMIKRIAAILILLLSFVAIFLITNAIKMTIHGRKEEIAIMRHVGAMNWYIQVPFMIEGMLIGIIGSILPCIVSYTGYAYLIRRLGHSAIQILPLQPFIWYVCICVVISSILVGMLGSFIATKRYLKLKR